MTAHTPSPSEEALREARELVACSDCGGQGWFGQQISETEQEQVQCGRCYGGQAGADEEAVKRVALALSEKEAEVGRLQNSAMFRRIELQKERIEQLEAALRKHGRHLSEFMCSAMNQGGHDCACGLDTALAPAPAKPEPKGTGGVADVIAAHLAQNPPADEGKREDKKPC